MLRVVNLSLSQSTSKLYIQGSNMHSYRLYKGLYDFLTPLLFFLNSL